MPIYKMQGKKDGKQKYRVRINYTDAQGEARQTERVAYGADAAKRLEMQLVEEMKETPPKQRLLIQELYDDYITNKKHEVKTSTLEKSKSILKNHVLPDLSTLRLDKFDLKQAQKWKLGMEEKTTSTGSPLQLKTKQNAFKEFSALLNYGIKMEYLHKNVLQRLGNFKDPNYIKTSIQYYTAEEFQKFMAAAKQCAEEAEIDLDNLEWHYFVFFAIAFYTGMRKGEINALEWTDIQGDYITVSKSVTQKLSGDDVVTSPKNNSSVRTLQLPQPLIKILKEHRARCVLMPDFGNHHKICGGPRALRDTSIQKKNTKYAKLAGVKTIRIHDFRHSHASLLANNGINIQEIARRLGHAKIEITWNTYSHLYPREEERAVAVLDKIV